MFKLKRSLIIVAPMWLILLQASLLVVRPAEAEKASTEFWSENDGMSVKYNTDHDDLLNSKGAEVSLASSQQQQAAHDSGAQQQGGAGENSDSTGQNEEESASAGEQGDDSRERPVVSRHKSDHLAPAPMRQPKTPPMVSNLEPSEDEDSPARSKVSRDQGELVDNDEEETPKVAAASRPDESDSETESGSGNSGERAEPEVPSQLSQQLKEQQPPLSYNSALEQAEEPEETASADPGPEPISEQPSIRFRQPGRLFKAAIRHEETGQSDNLADQGDEFNGRSEPSGPVPIRGNLNSAASQRQRNRGDMVDFDSVLEARRREKQDQQSPSGDSESESNDENGQSDWSANSGASHGVQMSDDFDSAPALNPHSNRLSSMASSPAKAERISPQLSPSNKNSKPTSQEKAPAYVREALAQQQQAKQQASRVSPDSVRDNFISPGHFPGSMAHLTSAESRTSGAEQQSQPSASPEPAGSRVDPVVVVTPAPEMPGDGQQIMAPILTPTTTVAPSLAAPTTPSAGPKPLEVPANKTSTTTTRSPEATKTTTWEPSTSKIPSSTSQAGETSTIVKRFKFRKLQ